MQRNSVTVDLLHPTVVRAFTNWGYISFFGVMAALITLLFFAIGQVKQADEARQQRAQPATPVAPMGQEAVPAEFVYSNSQLGFSIDYSSVAEGSGHDSLITNTRTLGNETTVTISDPTKVGTDGTPRTLLEISWAPDSRTLDQFEADGMAANRRKGITEEMMQYSQTNVGGVSVSRVHSSIGSCSDDTTYFFFRKGFRTYFHSPCNDPASSEALLRSLTFY